MLVFELNESEVAKWSISDLDVALKYFESITVLGAGIDIKREIIQKRELFRNEIDLRLQRVLRIKKEGPGIELRNEF